MKIQNMDEEEQRNLAHFEKMAASKVGEMTEFVVEAPTVKAMAEAIRNTEFGKVRGVPSEEGSYVVISYQPKLSGETSHMPYLRVCPLRNNPQSPGGAHFKKMIQAVIQSRLPAVDADCGKALQPSDCFIIGDGGKHGNHTAFLHAFCDTDGAHLPKTTKSMFVHYREEDCCHYKA